MKLTQTGTVDILNSIIEPLAIKYAFGFMDLEDMCKTLDSLQRSLKNRFIAMKYEYITTHDYESSPLKRERSVAT